MSETTKKSSGHTVWTYFLPVIHICACAITMSGHIVPSLEFLGTGWTYIMIADFPISLVAVALAWGHGAVATAWIFVVGTVWWYLLSLGVARILSSRMDVPLSTNNH